MSLCEDRLTLPSLVYDLTVETKREHVINDPPVDRKGTQNPHSKVTVDIGPVLCSLSLCSQNAQKFPLTSRNIATTILAPLVKSAFPWASALKPVI